jgi:hypothetical protein
MAFSLTSIPFHFSIHPSAHPSIDTHRQVRVTGNNRTKPSIIGELGVVRKAVGLGGWHWLRLENGVKCRLQRNALVIVKRASGLEIDSESESDEAAAQRTAANRHNGDGLNNGGNGTRVVNRVAHANGGHATARASALEPFMHRDALNDAPRPARTRAPSKRAPVSIGGKRHSRDDDAKTGPSVRFDKLRTETLEKISEKHYKLPGLCGGGGCGGGGVSNAAAVGNQSRDHTQNQTSSPPEKRRLVETLTKRFVNETVDETKVLVAFIKALAGGELPQSMKDDGYY